MLHDTETPINLCYVLNCQHNAEGRLNRMDFYTIPNAQSDQIKSAYNNEFSSQFKFHFGIQPPILDQKVLTTIKGINALIEWFPTEKIEMLEMDLPTSYEAYSLKSTIVFIDTDGIPTIEERNGFISKINNGDFKVDFVARKVNG